MRKAFSCGSIRSIRSRYSSVSSREELESGLVTRALQPLLQGASAEPILSFFVEEVSRQVERLLDELERLVREKRRKQESGR